MDLAVCASAPADASSNARLTGQNSAAPAPIYWRWIATFLLGLVLGMGTIAATLAPDIDAGLWPSAAERLARQFEPSSLDGPSFQRDGNNAPQPFANGIESEAPAPRQAKPLAEARPIATAEQLARPAYARLKNEHGGSIGLAANTSRRSVCVRLCDGFYFPVGYLNAPDEIADHEALCQAACPSAPVKVFTAGPGAETIDQAVSREMKSYASLPTAFAYRQTRPAAACSCRQGIARDHVSPFRDFTLRPGDAVVVEGGAQVFEGASRWPFRPSDFTDFRQASALSKREIEKLDEILDISRRERLLAAFKAGQDRISSRGFEVLKPRTGFVVLAARPGGAIRLVESRAALVVLR